MAHHRNYNSGYKKNYSYCCSWYGLIWCFLFLVFLAIVGGLIGYIIYHHSTHKHHDGYYNGYPKGTYDPYPDDSDDHNNDHHDAYDHKSSLCKYPVPWNYGYTNYRYHNASNCHASGYGTAKSHMKRYSKDDRDYSCHCKHMPHPRNISNVVFYQEHELVPDENGLSAMTWLWLQFIDHMITLVKSRHDIHIPIKGAQGIVGSDFSLDMHGEQQQINSLSAFMDGSAIYGSDDTHAYKLRLHKHGKLKTKEYYYGTGLPCNHDCSEYAAGDVRAGENSGLTAMHTLWVKEHNHWAHKLYNLYPNWDDEKLYQYARACVIAEIQHITYHECLPAILGKYTPKKKACYDPYADPSLFNEFSSASFRFGHSSVTDFIECSNGEKIALRNAFHAETPNSGNFFHVAKPEEILMGICKQPTNKIDSKVVDALRNFLFMPTSETEDTPMDLVSMNIARGRHHKIPSYSKMRWMFGGKEIKEWKDMCDLHSDPNLHHKMEQLYGEKGWDCVDLWVGLLVEPHEKGVSMGTTMAKMLAHQFELIRSGDIYYYEWNHLIKDYLHEIKKTKLMHIISRNYGVYLQNKEDAFHV